MSMITSSSHNKQFIQSSTQRAMAPIFRRNELSHIVGHNKKKGILTLRCRHLTWDSQEDTQKVLINLDTITDKQIAYNEKKETALLLIKSVDNTNGYIFSFEGGKLMITLEGRKEYRDKFFEFINKKDESYEEFFKNLNLFEKKRFLGIFMDDYLNFLFENIVIKKPILTREEFWSYIKRKYFNKLLNLKTLQLAQLTSKIILIKGEDELTFLYHGRNELDYKFKTKLLLSNDELNTLYEFNLGHMKKEENFWTEFLKNQKNNDTEIFGGFKGLYFTNEDRSKIADSRQMIGETLQHSGFIKRVPGSYKMSKLHEGMERYSLCRSNYLGPFLASAEFDYKDKEIKEKNPEEEFNKKEMSNLIENINNYSLRKLEGVNYISRNNLMRRNKGLQNNQKSSKINSFNGEVSNGHAKIDIPKPLAYSKVYTKYLEFKTDHINREVSKKDSVETFKKVEFINHRLTRQLISALS
jgi:hypothetical protein